MAHKSLVPKQRCLTSDENPTSFESWLESLIFHISLSDKSARFLSTGDLNTWTTAEDRGFTDDPAIGAEGAQGITAENRMNRQAKVALLNIILGSIASYATVISAKFIKNQSTSLESIWDRLRSYYGFRRVGSRILDITEIKLELNESRESLYERMYSFLEDQLLQKNGAVLHNGVKREQDEEFSPTLLNLLVTIWLHTLNPLLPSLVKQRFATQLRTQTVFTIREEISDSIPILLNELEEKECNINRTGAYGRPRYEFGGRDFNPMSKPVSNPRPKFNKPRNNNNRNPQRNCCLCESSGRPSNHFLSTCPFLPPEDKRFMNNSRMREISTEDANEYESEDEYVQHDEETAGAAMRNLSIKQNTQRAINIRRVDIFASPTLDVCVNSSTSRWTLDSGAEANVISISECKRLGLDIYPTSQSATQGDGKTPLPTFGEVHFVATRGHHKLFFNGLVVEHLDTPCLAGMPFHKVNHVQINYSQNLIVLEDCCKIQFDTKKRRNTISISALSIDKQTCILPGENASFMLPGHVPLNEPVAIEPRTTVPKDMPDWIKCQIVTPATDRSISIKNTSTEPILLGRHTQACQIRSTSEAVLSPSQEIKPGKVSNAPQIKPTVDSLNKFEGKNCINLNEANNLSKVEKENFRELHGKYEPVFTPGIGCYNNYSGEFQHNVNISPNLPPQRRGRIPDYCKDDKELLQAKFDQLLAEGVFSRAEEVKQPVEYVHPSFLVKKPSGGHRLVTSFGEMAEYAKPQPTINSNVEAALHQIGQFKEIIITDLKESYFQIPLNEESAKYVGVITPYMGTYVYRRSVMGLPGSEAALEELLSRIFGDLIRKGVMVKIADDIFLGSQSVQSLTEIWEEVLKRLQLNGLKLSSTKTKICPTSATILGWEWKSGSIRPGKHRINALINCDPPTTTKALRSYLGSYKFLSRVIPNYAEILRPLEQAVGGKQSSDKINWTEELICAFNKSKEHLSKIKPITLPKREDQLHLVTDASSVGIAGTLFVVRNNKPYIAGYFSAALKKNQPLLTPCELEALAISCSVKHFSYLIIQSTERTRILTDNRPCCLAYKNLLQGKFSASPKVTTFLSMATRYNVELIHISGSTNLFSDFASRHPVECKSPSCSVCTFIDDTRNSCVGEISVSDVISGKARMPYTTKSSWKQIQDSCPDLVKLRKYLTNSAKIPKKRKKFTDVKRYLNLGVTALTGNLNGLLVIKQTTPFKPTSYRVVIPRNVSDGLLTALHIQLNHPSTHQLKLLFSREFFCLDLDSKARKITESCHTCASLKKVPSLYHEQTTSEPDGIIGSRFSVDIVNRYSQCILILRENVTSYTEGTIIANEKSNTLREGLLMLVSKLRSKNGPKAIIRSDPASGFRTLLNDEMLKKFNIEIELGEPKNINKNPVAESAIQELHSALVRIQPLGGKITESVLAIAINQMNDLVRHHKLSSREAWTKRDMSTGQELQIKDESLINMKYKNRKDNHHASAKYKSRGKEKIPLPDVEVGNIVYIYSDRSKLRSREKYLVTAVLNDSVSVQKFTENQFRKRIYKVRKSDLIIIQTESHENSEQVCYCDPPSNPRKELSKAKPQYYNIENFQERSSTDTESSSDESDEEYSVDYLMKHFLPNVAEALQEEPEDNVENSNQQAQAHASEAPLPINMNVPQTYQDEKQKTNETGLGNFNAQLLKERLQELPDESFNFANSSQFDINEVIDEENLPEVADLLKELSPIFSNSPQEQAEDIPDKEKLGYSKRKPEGSDRVLRSSKKTESDAKLKAHHTVHDV